jgi:hypothetical protein
MRIVLSAELDASFVESGEYAIDLTLFVWRACILKNEGHDSSTSGALCIQKHLCPSKSVRTSLCMGQKVRADT